MIRIVSGIRRNIVVLVTVIVLVRRCITMVVRSVRNRVRILRWNRSLVRLR